MFSSIRLSKGNYYCWGCCLYNNFVRFTRRYFVIYLVTIYANVYKKKVIDQTSEGTINQGLIFAYIGSIVFLLFGISGLYGSLKTGKDKKGNKCLLGLYSIGVILFFFLFLAGTIVFFVGPKALFYENCNAGGT